MVVGHRVCAGDAGECLRLEGALGAAVPSAVPRSGEKQ